MRRESLLIEEAGVVLFAASPAELGEGIGRVVAGDDVEQANAVFHGDRDLDDFGELSTMAGRLAGCEKGGDETGEKEAECSHCQSDYAPSELDRRSIIAPRLVTSTEMGQLSDVQLSPVHPCIGRKRFL